MQPARTFMDRYIAGDVGARDIDRYIEAWHHGDSPLDLVDYLGMTCDEYGRWVIDAGVLPQIREERLHMEERLPTPEELRHRLNTGEIQFEFASQELVQQYRREIDRILVALGHPEAYVTDESYISDFPIGSREDEVTIEHISTQIGLPVILRDRLVDLAQRMKK